MSIKKNSFYGSFHGLRGLASIMVFMSHIINGYYLHIDSGVNQNLGLIVLAELGVFGVEIFFFLSGFVIYKSSKKSTLTNFFNHRFWRIYPVFFIFTVVFFIGNYFFNLAIEKQGIENLLFNLLFLEIFFQYYSLTPNSWSLTYEVWYYFITYFLVVYTFYNRYKILSIFSFFLLFYFLINFPITLYFCLGVILAIFEKVILEQVLKGGKVLNSTLQFIIFISIILVVYISEPLTWGVFFSFDLAIFVPFLLFLFMASLMRRDLLISYILQNKYMFFLGNISYVFYLAHPYAYFICREFSIYFNFTNFILFFILSFFLSLFISYVISRFIEAPIYYKMTGKSIYSINRLPR